jgi:hypothetical protein
MFNLELRPAGEVELPVGSQIRPAAIAVYGSDDRVEIDADRLTWTVLEESPGIEFQDSTVTAVSAALQPVRLRAEYEEQAAELSIHATAAVEQTLRLDFGQEVLFPGDSGSLRLVASQDNVGEPAISQAKISSSDPEVVKIDAAGRWQAIRTGTTELSVAHPALAEPLRESVEVAAPDSSGLMFDPDVLVLGVGQAAKAKLLVVAASGEDGEPVAHPVDQLDRVRFAAADESLTLRGPWIIGRRATQATEVTAEYQGMTASLLVEVRDVPVGTPIRIVPDALTVAVGSTFRPVLQQQVPKLDSSDSNPGAAVDNTSEGTWI